MSDEQEEPIPAFLLRTTDNKVPDVSVGLPAPSVKPRTDSGFQKTPEPGEEVKPDLRDEQAKVKKAKAYKRLAVMNDRKAAKTGKRWDPNRCKWIED